ncbi:MAG: ester cyclase [Rhodospirillaceae bacterium]|nr:ester cyclase [Rhodospirillaceae bacterium]
MKFALIAAVAALSINAVRAEIPDKNSGPKGEAVCVGHEANRDLYFQVLDVIFNKRDLTRVEEFFAPEFKNHNAPAWAAQGPAAIRQYLPMLAGAFPDRAVVHEFVLCDGDYVIARTHVTGTSKGPYMGQQPTGKTYKVTGTDIYRVKNGKFTDRWGNEDALGMMQQLGYMPDRPPLTSENKEEKKEEKR